MRFEIQHRADGSVYAYRRWGPIRYNIYHALHWGEYNALPCKDETHAKQVIEEYITEIELRRRAGTVVSSKTIRV